LLLAHAAWIEAEIPQKAHGRFRGIGADSPVFAKQKCARRLSRSDRKVLSWPLSRPSECAQILPLQNSAKIPPKVRGLLVFFGLCLYILRVIEYYVFLTKKGNTMSLNNAMNILRIGIFYDGYYFYKVSNYYKYEHPKKARISISGLHNFIRNEVAILSGTDIKQCQIVDAHYFKGRSSAKEMGDKVQNERMFEDILMRENIVTHYLPLRYGENNVLQEKGIDVWLALEAYELASYKRFDILVLVACDGDYVPLVRKLNTMGTHVMLISWDFTYHTATGYCEQTRTSQQLLEEVFHPVSMHQLIDSRVPTEYVKNLFVTEKYIEDAQPFSSLEEKNTVRDFFETEKEDYFSVIQSIREEGYGFIEDKMSNNVFFHYSIVENRDFNELRPGLRVKYQREEDAERSKKEGGIRYRATKATIID
jgi:uncharacterized LabA/DUF88 family protein